MTIKIDYTCPNCFIDLKTCGIKMQERTDYDLATKRDGWGIQKGSYALRAFCKSCQKEVLDYDILADLYREWCG